MTENKSLSFAEFPDPNVVFPNEYGTTVFSKNGLFKYERFGDKPARPIKKRFDDEMIALLRELKWWDFAPARAGRIFADAVQYRFGGRKGGIEKRLQK